MILTTIAAAAVSWVLVAGGVDGNLQPLDTFDSPDACTHAMDTFVQKEAKEAPQDFDALYLIACVKGGNPDNKGDQPKVTPEQPSPQSPLNHQLH